MIEVERQVYEMIPLDSIVSTLPVRRISASGLKRVQASMERVGFLQNYPLVVTPCENGYQLIDGRHRYEAAKLLNFLMVPCVVKTDLTKQEQYKLALESNSAAETVVPSTLVTFAEFVRQQSERYTLAEIGNMLGWSEAKTKQYSALAGICTDAWDVIVTSFEKCSNQDATDSVTKEVTPVTFSEFLLRSILDLTSEQQTELVTRLATEKDFTKGKFKTLAECYQARNEMKEYAAQVLGDMGEETTSSLFESIDTGAYDSEWKADKAHSMHPKLDKLLQSLRDEWERKHSIHLVHGNFYKEVAKIGAGSIDLILTDPPYNVASERTFTGLASHGPVSQNFGSWDKIDSQEYIDLFAVWAREWERILKNPGSGYVFTSPKYCSYLWLALEKAGLYVRTVVVWYKPNPGVQYEHVNYKNSVEYVLFFTKGSGDHTFNWQGENEMQNHIVAPICQGKERQVDAEKHTLHPTQKPEQVIKHLMEISSNRGDMVFDGFMGVGTTGMVAKSMGRKFIGIEQDKTYFDAAQRRLAE